MLIRIEMRQIWEGVRYWLVAPKDLISRTQMKMARLRFGTEEPDDEYVEARMVPYHGRDHGWETYTGKLMRISLHL